MLRRAAVLKRICDRRRAQNAMINGKKIFVLILKPSHEELDEVIKIIERTGVPFERREKPFYFYKYCIKNCIRNGIKKNDF